MDWKNIMLHLLTLNWNGEKYLKKLYDSLCNSLPINMVSKWWIADNGSTDNSVKVLKEFINTEVIEVGHNRNTFAIGTNKLFELSNPADDDLILLLNNDVEFVDNTAISNMINLMNKTKAGVVGLRLLYMGTDKLQHAGVIFSDKYNRLPYHYRPGEKTDKEASKNRYFQAVTAAVCLIKASSFKKVNGMDPAFKWSFDDIDLFLRIGQTEKIVYCGESYAYHEESISLKKNPVNKLYLNSNKNYFKQKWAGKYEIDHDKYLKDKNYNVVD